MSVAAFHVGLKHKMEELENLFADAKLYHDAYNSTELRKILIKREIPSSIDEDALYSLAKSVLDLAKEGLVERCFGEEVFLDSLYKNVKERTNSGKRLLDALDEGISIEELIRDYGELD